MKVEMPFGQGDLDDDRTQEVKPGVGFRMTLPFSHRLSPSQNRRQLGKEVPFIPYRIDSNSGVGTQVVAGDINGDKWDDVIVGNKKGTFVFTHVAEPCDRQKWEAAQPQIEKSATEK